MTTRRSFLTAMGLAPITLSDNVTEPQIDDPPTIEQKIDLIKFFITRGEGYWRQCNFWLEDVANRKVLDLTVKDVTVDDDIVINLTATARGSEELHYLAWSTPQNKRYFGSVTLSVRYRTLNRNDTVNVKYIIKFDGFLFS